MYKLDATAQEAGGMRHLPVFHSAALTVTRRRALMLDFRHNKLVPVTTDALQVRMRWYMLGVRCAPSAMLNVDKS